MLRRRIVQHRRRSPGQRGRHTAGSGKEPYLAEGRQEPDGQGRPTHEQQGDHQDPLAAKPIAEVGEEDPAEGPEQESDGEGAETGQQRRRGEMFGKKSLLNTSADAVP